MYIEFINELGTLKFDGRGMSEFSICEVEGLEPCEKNRVVRSYIGEDGCHEDSSQYTSRAITISGDIKINDTTMLQLKRAALILSRKGTLRIKQEDDFKNITVNYATFKIGHRYNKYYTYAVQFTCDYPHFVGSKEYITTIFTREDKLKYDSVLPTVLSERISEGTVNNAGDLKIYPVIVIKKEADIIENNIIEITNKNTSKNIIINKAMVCGEEIVVNVKNRTIESSIDGNILGNLSLYSSLNEFWCDRGENIISVSLDGIQKGISVYVKFFNEYLEAI